MRGRDERDRGGGIGSFFVVIVLQMVLGLLASMIVAAFSRYREYRERYGRKPVYYRRMDRWTELPVEFR